MACFSGGFAGTECYGKVLVRTVAAVTKDFGGAESQLRTLEAGTGKTNGFGKATVPIYWA